MPKPKVKHPVNLYTSFNNATHPNDPQPILPSQFPKYL